LERGAKREAFVQVLIPNQVRRRLNASTREVANSEVLVLGRIQRFARTERSAEEMIASLLIRKGRLQ